MIPLYRGGLFEGTDYDRVISLERSLTDYMEFEYNQRKQLEKVVEKLQKKIEKLEEKSFNHSEKILESEEAIGIHSIDLMRIGQGNAKMQREIHDIFSCMNKQNSYLDKRVSALEKKTDEITALMKNLKIN